MSVKGLIYKIARIFKRTKGKPCDEKLVEDLMDRIVKLEKKQQELEESLEKEYCVKSIVVERMHADKVEFNIDTIDVDELSGMLSIGLNYEGKLVKILSDQTGKTKDKDKNANKSEGSKENQRSRPKITMFFDTKPNSDS